MNWKLHGMKFYDSCFNVAFPLTLILCGGSFFCGGGGLTRKDDILLLQLKNFIVKLHKIAAAPSLYVCVMVAWWVWVYLSLLSFYLLFELLSLIYCEVHENEA